MHIFVEFLQTQSIFYLFLIFLIGLAVGSFLNVVIIRLPRMIERDWREECCNLLDVNPENTKQKEQFNLITPSSHCPFCKQKIKIIENIPLLSYLFLKGKCSNCKEKISLRYPIIEFASAVSVCIAVSYTHLTLPTILLV